MSSSFPGVSRTPLSHLPGSSGASTSLATTYRQDVSFVQSFNSNACERNRHAYTPFSSVVISIYFMELLVSGTGIYTGTSAPEEEGNFLTERCCLNRLAERVGNTMPMWKVEQCMEMFFCSTGIYLLFHYSMLPTTVICLFLLFKFLSVEKLICSKSRSHGNIINEIN